MILVKRFKRESLSKDQISKLSVRATLDRILSVLTRECVGLASLSIDDAFHGFSSNLDEMSDFYFKRTLKHLLNDTQELKDLGDHFSTLPLDKDLVTVEGYRRKYLTELADLQKRFTMVRQLAMDRTGRYNVSLVLKSNSARALVLVKDTLGSFLRQYNNHVPDELKINFELN